MNSAVEFGIIRGADINAICNESFINNHREVFEGLGKIPGSVKIQLTNGAIPKKHYNKRFPLSVKDKLKAELNALVKDGIISEVTEPT